MRNWAIHRLNSGRFLGEPDPQRLETVLNQGTGQAWRLARRIDEGTRQWFFFTFAEHLLIVLHADEQFSAILAANSSPSAAPETAPTPAEPIQQAGQAEGNETEQS